MNRAFRKVSHVIFDMDGLLLDTESIYTEATQKLVGQYGKVYTPEIKLKIMGFLEAHVAEMLVETLDLPITPEEYLDKIHELHSILMPHAKLMPDSERLYRNVIHNIAKRYGKVYTSVVMTKLLGTPQWDTCKIAVQEMKLPISADEFNEEFNNMTNKDLPNVGLLPGAARFVRHLHRNNIPMAVATSSSKHSYEIKTQNHQELFSLFSHKVTGASDPEVKKGKPSPDIFLVCASRFPDKPNPEKCLVFEDAPNGVRAAVDAGMQCVMVPEQDLIPLEFRKEATLVIDSLEKVEPEKFGLPPF